MIDGTIKSERDRTSVPHPRVELGTRRLEGVAGHPAREAGIVGREEKIVSTIGRGYRMAARYPTTQPTGH